MILAFHINSVLISGFNMVLQKQVGFNPPEEVKNKYTASRWSPAISQNLNMRMRQFQRQQRRELRVRHSSCDLQSCCRHWISEYWVNVPRGNTRLGSCDLLIKTFSSTDEHITLFCMCLKMHYLIYIFYKQLYKDFVVIKTSREGSTISLMLDNVTWNFFGFQLCNNTIYYT